MSPCWPCGCMFVMELCRMHASELCRMHASHIILDLDAVQSPSEDQGASLTCSVKHFVFAHVVWMLHSQRFQLCHFMSMRMDRDA